MKSPSPKQLKVKSWVWLGLIPLLLILSIFFPYRGWTILLIGLGGAYLVSYLWLRHIKDHLSLQREMRYGWAQVGDMLEERFTLRNTGSIPALWVEVHDFSTIPDYKASRATGVGSKSENSWMIHQVCSRRGLYTLGPTELLTGDPFSLLSLTIRLDTSATILVTPPVLPLPSIQVATGGRAGEGRSSRRAMEESVLTNGVREFASGDSLRRIHWPTTARRDETFVKTFDNLPMGDWWILVDLDASTQSGQGMESTEEVSVILAASLADRGIRSGVPVGLIANGAELAWLPPRLGDLQRWQILEALAKASPSMRSLSELIQKASPAIRQQASLILITSNTHGDWLSGLMSLAWKGAVPTVLLLDPQSFGSHPGITGVQNALVDQGITVFPITPEVINQPRVANEARNVWEWRFSPTGKAVPIHRPNDLSWRKLA